jgi:hypothetical protein
MAAIHIPIIVKVVGVSYHPGEVAQLAVDQAITVEHDPTNPFDSNACVVRTLGGAELGHVPAAVAARLIAERTERRWTGRVAEIYLGEHTGFTIRIEAGSDVECGSKVPPNRATDVISVNVRSKSGRVLGQLVRCESDKVVVINGSGIEFGYPRSLVLVD